MSIPRLRREAGRRSPGMMQMIRLAPAALCVAAVIASSAQATEAAAAPPLGRYNCYQFDPSTGYLPSGWFKLLGGKRYVLYTKNGGRYSYSPAGRRLTWLSGPYKAYGWVGEFLPKGRDGRKGYTIVLKEKVHKDGIKIHCYWQAPGA
jgi:hypothetical protein